MVLFKLNVNFCLLSHGNEKTARLINFSGAIRCKLAYTHRHDGNERKPELPSGNGVEGKCTGRRR